MAETSYFWDGITQGDAINHPLRQDKLAKFFSMITQMDRSAGSIIWSKHSDYDGKLFADIAGNTITVEDGAAIIDGTIYLNDAQIAHVTAAGEKVALVIKKTWEGINEKTVILNFPDVMPGQDYYESQDEGNIWDIHFGGYDNLVAYSESVDYYPGIKGWVNIDKDNIGNYIIEYLGGGVLQAGTIELTWDGVNPEISGVVTLPIGANIDYECFFAFCTIRYGAGYNTYLTSITTPPLHGSFTVSVYTYDDSVPGAATFYVDWLVFCKPYTEVT